MNLKEFKEKLIECSKEAEELSDFEQFIVTYQLPDNSTSSTIGLYPKMPAHVNDLDTFFVIIEVELDQDNSLEAKKFLVTNEKTPKKPDLASDENPELARARLFYEQMNRTNTEAYLRVISIMRENEKILDDRLRLMLESQNQAPEPITIKESQGMDLSPLVDLFKTYMRNQQLKEDQNNEPK